jgi:formyltetrahydrofolate-dependent phosphoribosylglycinamide formyltransferase
MDKLKVAVLISGRGTNLQSLIDACQQPDFPAEIVAVITNVPEVEGIKRAQKAGIDAHVLSHKAFTSRRDFDTALNILIESTGANFVCLAGFMRLLTADFTNKWEGKIINIHPSLLPAFKGANAHKDVIAARVNKSGCTVHFVTEEMDSGEIIVQKEVPVYPEDTEETLSARVLEQEHIAYPEALKIVASQVSS